MNPSTSTSPPPAPRIYPEQQPPPHLHSSFPTTPAILYNGSPTHIRPVRAIHIQIRRATFVDEQMRPVPQSAKMSFLVIPPASTISQTPFDDRLSLPTIFSAF